MKMHLVPSPTKHVALKRYRKEEFPVFQTVFESTHEDSALLPFAQEPDAAETAVVIQNLSHKDVTALRYRWVIADANGKSGNSVASSDSYMIDIYRPVIAPGSRLLITQIGMVDEAQLNPVLASVSGIGSGGWPLLDDKAEEVRFRIDLVLFSDGEIAGSDPDDFATQLQFRKRAADYVAQQIRSANAEGRDVMPVLTALRDVPRARTDQMARLIAEFSGIDIRRSVLQFDPLDMKAVTLRYLENRPRVAKVLSPMTLPPEIDR